MSCIRLITEQDIDDLFEVRVKTRENLLTREQLSSMGITPASVAQMMQTTHRGWLCEVDNQVVGFVMGNKQTGEMWVIAILPEHENKGIGKALMHHVETWLWEQGHNTFWLTTDIDPTLRAYGFYQHLGWEDWEIRDGCRYMKKTHA